MKTFDGEKQRLLQDIDEIMGAIDDEVDWFIASFSEKDSKKRNLARTYFYEKQKERVRLAKEAYERYK